VLSGLWPAGDPKVWTVIVALQNGRSLPAELERTTLKALDSYELDKETLAKAKGFEVASTAMSLLAEAGKHKAKPEEVRSWAERAYKAAEPYGPRVQTDLSLDIAE